MDVHKRTNTVPKTSPEGVPKGYLRLSKELAESYGMSYRQLWRKAREGKIAGALQTEGGSWYIPAGVDVERERQQIDAPMRARIKGALSRGMMPTVIAYKEGISDDAVYSIRREYQEERRQQRERLEQMMKDNPREVVGLHRGGYTAITATDFAAADPEVLAQLVRFEGYFDPSRNVFYASPETVQEIVEWEDARTRRLEERYQDVPEEIRRRLGPG